MNRILILLTGLFFSGASCAFGGGGETIDETEIRNYRNHHCMGSENCALAMSSDGAFGYGVHAHTEIAQGGALASCRIYAHEPDTCEIVDVGGQSEFVRMPSYTLGEKYKTSSESVQQINTVTAENTQDSSPTDWSSYLPRYGFSLGKGAEGDHLFRLEKSPTNDLVIYRKNNWYEDHIPIIPNAGSLAEVRNRHFEVTKQVGWYGALSTFRGTIERFAYLGRGKHYDVVMLSEEEWIAYQTARRNNVGKPFSTAEWAEVNRTESVQQASTPEATKTIDPPEPQAPEAVASQPTETDKSIELEFWQSIKNAEDPQMYRAYLRQFPSGVYAELAKIKIKKLGGDTTVANTSIPNLDYGDYYALVIGNNEYQDLTDLRSAVNDAKVVSTVLEVDYGFNVKLLENASRKEILRSLKELRQSVSAKDNVLIYYAGHGYLDEAADQGYWLPVDSERDDDSNWIPTDRVAGQIKAMKAKHVMVVADSCFSGTITRAIKIEQRTPAWLSEIVKKKARTALTSGGLEPVLDTGSGNHSAFAYAFISLLEENNGVLDASQLFSQLRPKVMVNATQTPEYSNIHQAGHDGGDFLFVRR